MSPRQSQNQPKPAPDRAKLFVDAFLVWMEVQKGASPATLKAYGSDLAQLAEFLRGQDADLGRPESVTKRHIQAYLAWLFRLGDAKSSMARKLAAARSYFRFQQRSNAVAENVAAQVRNPRQEKRRGKLRDSPGQTAPRPSACFAATWHWPNCCMALACVFLRRWALI